MTRTLQLQNFADKLLYASKSQDPWHSADTFIEEILIDIDYDPILFDFKGITAFSFSWANRVFGYLVEKYGLLNFLNRVSIGSCSDVQGQIVIDVLSQYIQEGTSELVKCGKNKYALNLKLIAPIDYIEMKIVV